MCHLSNACLSLADTFICTHFCHWIRNITKRVCLTFERFGEWVKGRPSKGTRNSVNMQKWPAQNGQQKPATCFAKLLQNEWNNDAARFTTLESTCLATSQVTRSCCSKMRAVLLFATKSIQCCAFHRPKAKLFCNKWRNSRVWRDSRVILSNQKSVFTQLTTTWFVPRKVWTMVVKRATLLFHSLCSNVSKQAARFFFGPL